MPFSPKLVNAIFFIALSLAISTSILAIVKLTPAITNSISQPAESPLGSVYEASPYISPAAWIAVLGALIWRGKIRSVWSRQGYDYEQFKIVTRMRGSETRIRLLRSLDVPKNKLQLANEFRVDWKTIDNHIKILEKHKLVEEMALVGTSKYYIISGQGKKVLELLSNGNNASSGSRLPVNDSALTKSDNGQDS